MSARLDQLRRDFVATLPSDLRDREQLDALFMLLALALHERGPEVKRLARLIGARKDWSPGQLATALERFRAQHVPHALDAAFRRFARTRVIERETPNNPDTGQRAFQARTATTLP